MEGTTPHELSKYVDEPDCSGKLRFNQTLP